MNIFNRFNIVIVILIIFLNISLWSFFKSDDAHIDDHSPELHELMDAMQRYLHKYNLAIHHENDLLAGFYLHELEELSEHIINYIDTYDGHPVGELTNTMLIPVIKRAEKIVENGNRDKIRESVSMIVQSCNNCHLVAGHEYIIIKEISKDNNPFNQDFSVKK